MENPFKDYTGEQMYDFAVVCVAAAGSEYIELPEHLREFFEENATDEDRELFLSDK